MKKRDGSLILPAIGLDFVIQQPLITFFCPEIINVSNHSTAPKPRFERNAVKRLPSGCYICDDIGSETGICLDNHCLCDVTGF